MNTCNDSPPTPTAAAGTSFMSLAITATAMLAALILSCSASTANAAEWRAFWVDTWGASILNQSQVDTLLGVPGTSTKGQIRDANCNAVFIEARRNCDACYPSSMGEPYMSGLTPSDFNALQAATNWTALCTNAGNGALRILTDPTATGLRRLYRMRQW